MERVLSSGTFSRSERARMLLRYLVESELAGDAARLKGFSIALDVFGKNADFDPSVDALVRVQASRLRELLAQYYAEEGKDDPVKISIPRGAYVPAYSLSEPEKTDDPAQDDASRESEEASAAPTNRAQSAPADIAANRNLTRHLRLVWLSIGTLAVLVCAFLYMLATPAPVRPRLTTSSTSLVSPLSASLGWSAEQLPTVRLAATGSDPNVARVAAMLRRGLSGFDTVTVVASEQGPNGAPISALDYVFDVHPDVDSLSVGIELRHAESGRVLLSRSLLAAEIADARSLEDRIAALLNSAIPVSGVIYGDIDKADLQFGLSECLLLNDDYYFKQTEENHAAAYRCFERLAAAEAKSPLVYSALSALHAEAISDGFDYPAGASYEQALALAQQAVQMGPTSPYAHRAYGFLNSRLGNGPEATKWTRRAYELNTFDLSMAASYGYALLLAGFYKESVPLLQRAVDLSSAHPAWWDYSLFLGKFMMNDTAGAARSAQLLASASNPRYLAARLVASSQEGEAAEAAKLRSQLAAEFPDFSRDPQAAFRKSNYPPDLTDRFTAALKKAGLTGK